MPESPSWSVAVSLTFASSPVHHSLTRLHVMSASVMGASPSMLMLPTVVPAASLPARSVAGPLVTDWSRMLRATVSSVGHEATPDRVSWQVKATVTGPLYHPAPLGAVVASPSMVGGVRSILMSETEPSPVLPALSLTVAVADRASPSLVTVLSAGFVGISMPDRPSTAVHSMVTSSRYQPAAFAAGGPRPVSSGAGLSMLTPPNVWFSEFPATST